MEKEAPPAAGQAAREGSSQVIEPATVGEAADEGGTSSSGESGKRKRRRRKGKGSQQSGAHAGPAHEEIYPVVAPESAAAEGSAHQAARPPRDQAPRDPQREAQARPFPPAGPTAPPRRKVDPDLVAKKAWKIYLAEVSEEGVALIGDNDAKELARRCFRLAEIFLDETVRRTGGPQ
jgi:hypothetical protein